MGRVGHVQRLGCSERSVSSERAVKIILEQCRGAPWCSGARLLKAGKSGTGSEAGRCCEGQPRMFRREGVSCRGLQDVPGQRRGALQAAAAGS